MRKLFRQLHWSYVHWRCMRLLEFWHECAGFTGGFDIHKEILRRVAPWRRTEFAGEVQFFIDALTRIDKWEKERGISAGVYDIERQEAKWNRVTQDKKVGGI